MMPAVEVVHCAQTGTVTGRSQAYVPGIINNRIHATPHPRDGAAGTTIGQLRSSIPEFTVPRPRGLIADLHRPSSVGA